MTDAMRNVGGSLSRIGWPINTKSFGFFHCRYIALTRVLDCSQIAGNRILKAATGGRKGAA